MQSHRSTCIYFTQCRQFKVTNLILHPIFILEGKGSDNIRMSLNSAIELMAVFNFKQSNIMGENNFTNTSIRDI